MLFELAVRYEQTDGMALPEAGGYLDQDQSLLDAVLAVVARIRWAKPQK